MGVKCSMCLDVYMLRSHQQTVHRNGIQDVIGEENAVIQGLVEARMSYSGSPLDILARVSS